MQDIVEKIQQGNWTAQDVDRAVMEVIRLRKELADERKNLAKLFESSHLTYFTGAEIARLILLRGQK